MKKPTLTLAPPAPTPSTVDRGPWLDARQISERFYQGRMSPRWCTQKVAIDSRRKLGRTYLWREQDVVDWMATQ